MSRFKVGDYVKGNDKTYKKYSITNAYMTLARVVNVDFAPSIKIQVIKHDHDMHIGMITSVDENDMDLVDMDSEIIHDIEKEQRCENCEHYCVRFSECYALLYTDKKMNKDTNVLEKPCISYKPREKKIFS